MKTRQDLPDNGGATAQQRNRMRMLITQIY
jgi:hypothetical protein